MKMYRLVRRQDGSLSIGEVETVKHDRKGTKKDRLPRPPRGEKQVAASRSRATVEVIKLRKEGI